jgi:hypothetical protein
MLQKARELTPGLLACSLLLLAGCATPEVASQLAKGGQGWGKLSLFGRRDGLANLSITVIDNRPRSFRTQSFTDAGATDSYAAYNGILFKLTNSVKLRGAKYVALAASGSVYNAAFTGLPSDSNANDYNLVVGLYRNVTTPTATTDAAYVNSDLTYKVGEGYTSFPLTAGTTYAATVTINAVGQINLDSGTTFVNSFALPTFEAGDTTATCAFKLNLADDPTVTNAAAWVAAASNSVPISGTRLAIASTSLPAGTGASYNSTSLPGFNGLTAGTYYFVVEASSSTGLVSRRFRLFQVENSATLSVNLN